MIKLIIFDLWYTLGFRDVDYSLSRKIIELAGLKISREEFIKIFERAVQTKRWRSKYKAYENLCREIGLKTTQENVGKVIEIRDTAEAKSRLYPFVIPLLKKLRTKGYKIGLLSNSSVFAVEATKKNTELFEYIDYAVFPYDVGAIKPDLKIYKEMLKVAGCQPQEALMIGDSWENDVLVPQSLGMKAIHFKNEEQLKRDLEDFGIF